MPNRLSIATCIRTPRDTRMSTKSYTHGHLGIRVCPGADLEFCVSGGVR